MSIPWYQITDELIEVTAPELSVKLGISEAEAGWGLTKMFKWALKRCPENAPPSAGAVLTGSHAAAMIARSADFKGDPDRYVDECCKLAFPVLERVEGGVRVRGLDRYDALWGKNRKEEWAAWKLANPGKESEPGLTSDGTVPERKRKRAGSGTQDRDVDVERDSKTTTTATAPAAVPKPPPPKLKAPADPFESAEAFWRHFQCYREDLGLVAELPINDRTLSTFWTEVHMALGLDVQERLLAAVYEFALDPYWRGEKLPFAAFAKKWRKHVPERKAPKKLEKPQWADTPASRAYSARLDELRAKGDAYAVSQLVDLEPRQRGEQQVLWCKDHFRRDFVEEHFAELLPGWAFDCPPLMEVAS